MILTDLAPKTVVSFGRGLLETFEHHTVANTNIEQLTIPAGVASVQFKTVNFSFFSAYESTGFYFEGPHAASRGFYQAQETKVPGTFYPNGEIFTQAELEQRFGRYSNEAGAARMLFDDNAILVRTAAGAVKEFNQDADAILQQDLETQTWHKVPYVQNKPDVKTGLDCV